MSAAYRDGLPPLPSRMLALPLDARGYPVPYFVEWVDGKPDFRLVDHQKVIKCVVKRRCFICGEPLGKYMAFVSGPSSTLHRVSHEPPSHVECAEYAVRVCPFMVNPLARYREANLPREVGEATPNPGITGISTTLGYHVLPGRSDILTYDPIAIAWWCEGREATGDEIEAAARRVLESQS